MPQTQPLAWNSSLKRTNQANTWTPSLPANYEKTAQRFWCFVIVFRDVHIEYSVANTTLSTAQYWEISFSWCRRINQSTNMNIKLEGQIISTQWTGFDVLTNTEIYQLQRKHLHQGTNHICIVIIDNKSRSDDSQSSCVAACSAGGERRRRGGISTASGAAWFPQLSDLWSQVDSARHRFDEKEKRRRFQVVCSGVAAPARLFWTLC